MKFSYLYFLDLNWHDVFLGKEDWSFLLNVAVRTFVMFLVILIGLRLLGKRGIQQLSVFELGVIIGLGSAAGDPMFYSSVGLLACMLVFVVVVALYHILKYLISRSDRLESWVEGKPVQVLKEGELILSKLHSETISLPELFVQLRQSNITHLGQVQQAILEPTGDVSIFYYPDEEVRYGLPVLPALYEQKTKQIKTLDHWACTHCGHTMILEPAEEAKCPVCGQKEWTKAITGKRIT